MCGGETCGENLRSLWCGADCWTCPNHFHLLRTAPPRVSPRTANASCNDSHHSSDSAFFRRAICWDIRLLWSGKHWLKAPFTSALDVAPPPSRTQYSVLSRVTVLVELVWFYNPLGCQRWNYQVWQAASSSKQFWPAFSLFWMAIYGHGPRPPFLGTPPPYMPVCVDPERAPTESLLFLCVPSACHQRPTPPPAPTPESA